MSHYQDQYYNNQLYQGEYVGGYQQEQSMRNYNPQMQESNHYYSTPDVNTGTPANDDDNASVVSSVYSQPSVIGTSPANYAQYYQGQSNTFEQRQQPLVYHDDDPMDYPPSPLAASTNTHNSVVGLTTQQGLPSYDQNEKNYTNYTEENQYNEFSQNSKSQFDVYNDFNNTYRKDESYDDEDTRNNTLIGTNGNSYAMNINSDNLSGTGKAIRHSTTGEHFVVSNKKNRRCAFCTRKICVIVTFVVLLLLGGGMYFVWPRVPKIEMFPPTAVGNAEITLNPSASAKMQMDLQIELDNRDNWLPYKFKSFKVDVYNAERISSYNRPITSAEKKGFSISGRAKTTISVPISIDYSVAEKNDPIVQDFISACTKPPEGESRTPLNFRFDIKMFIAGLDWVFKPTRSVPVSNFQCPFEAERPSPTDEPIPEQDVETKQPATDPPKDPTTPAPDPATDPAKEPTTDPAKEPATDPAKEPATDPNAPAPDPATDPAKEPATPPPQDPNVPAPDPAKEPATDPATPPPQDPNVPAPDPATDPAKEPATDPATAPPQDPNVPAPEPAT